MEKKMDWKKDLFGGKRRSSGSKRISKDDKKKKDKDKDKKEKKDKDKKKDKHKDSGTLLELGLLCDCTSSMSTWIVRAKQTLQEIITSVQASTDGLKVRVCFIGYRDHCDGASKRFSIKDFTCNIDEVRGFIDNVQATGGGDIPEDVVGGLRKCLNQDWTSGSKRQVFLICDAPEHGKQYWSGSDHYPNGSPEGYKIPDLMQELHSKDIQFAIIKLDNNCDKMIAEMQKNHASMQVLDFVNLGGKSAAEVTKMFVEKATNTIKMTVGDFFKAKLKAKIPGYGGKFGH